MSSFNTVFGGTGIPEGFSFILAVDWLLDRGMTVLNVTGNTFVAGMVASMCVIDDEDDVSKTSFISWESDDENDFFRQVTLRIFSSLDSKTAMESCMSYLQQYIPISGMYFLLYDPDLNVGHMLATIFPGNIPAPASTVSFPKEHWDELKERFNEPTWVNVRAITFDNQIRPAAGVAATRSLCCQQIATILLLRVPGFPCLKYGRSHCSPQGNPPGELRECCRNAQAMASVHRQIPRDDQKPHMTLRT